MREWHVKRARDPKPGGVKHGSSKYAPTQSAQGKEGLEERRVVHLAPATAGLGHLPSDPRTDQIEQATQRSYFVVQNGGLQH